MARSIYTVAVDGTLYDIEGDRPPTEAEARDTVKKMQAVALPAGATAGMMAPSTATDQPSSQMDRVRAALEKDQLEKDARNAAERADAKEHPVLTAAQVALTVGGPAILAKVPGVIGSVAGATNRAMDAYPAITGAVMGGAEGAIRSKGDPWTIAKDAAIGATGGGLYGRLGRALDRIAPAAPVAHPTGTPEEQLKALLQTPQTSDPAEIERLAAIVRASRAAPVAAPVASTPAFPTTLAAPVGAESAAGRPAESAPSPKSSMSPQRIQNELGLAARRSKVTLTEPQYQQAADLVNQGKSPMEAVLKVGKSAEPVAVAKPRLLAAETREYVRLRTAGKTDQQAMDAIAAARNLAKTLGTPSSETVRQAVVKRNATGRWEAEQ